MVCGYHAGIVQNKNDEVVFSFCNRDTKCNGYKSHSLNFSIKSWKAVQCSLKMLVSK